MTLGRKVLGAAGQRLSAATSLRTTTVSSFFGEPTPASRVQASRAPKRDGS
jgi:hypothetical protein